jgi:uncharacterized protein (TIGR04255 family)
MPFPDAKRVIFEKNPLDRVICQLRFPPILRIEAEIPSAFQDAVRKWFPNYSESSDLKLEVPAELKGKLPVEILALMQSGGFKNYAFFSENGDWKINLTRTFMSLTAKNYYRWEDFKKQLLIPLRALKEVYDPAFFSRVGLRYIDIIKRSDLELENADWMELLQSPVLGIMSSPHLANSIKSYESTYEIKLSEEPGLVRIITKLFEDPRKMETCFMIDSDFFTSKRIEVEEALTVLDYFSVRGSRLIQWCITDRLRNAMEPKEI